MPIFEYVCESCRQEFEELVFSPDDECRTTCPKCGSGEVARRLSVFAAHGSTNGGLPSMAAGGCSRCGDPDGPCAL